MRTTTELLAEMSNVQRLVHLALRRDSQDVTELTAALTKARRRAFEDELTAMLSQVGCGGQGRLTRGPELKALSEQSAEEAQGIADTYNRDLAFAILTIGQDAPRANRFVYASRLAVWDENRAAWKTRQIAEWTEGTARTGAVRAFLKNNNLTGEARVVPETAAEPVCEGWIKRGWVPVRELMADPPPYHPNCPHSTESRLEKIPRAECADLWRGE